MDLLAKRRLRNVQPIGGVGEVQFLRGGDEVLKMAELHKRFASAPSLFELRSILPGTKMLISPIGRLRPMATGPLRGAGGRPARRGASPAPLAGRRTSVDRIWLGPERKGRSFPYTGSRTLAG